MSKASDKIDAYLRSLPSDKMFDGLPERTPKMIKAKKRSTFVRILKLFGIGDSWGRSSSSSTTAPSAPSAPEPSFRQEYKAPTIPTAYNYDPVAADNLRIYLQGQDGKGDPPSRGGHHGGGHGGR